VCEPVSPVARPHCKPAATPFVPFSKQSLDAREFSALRDAVASLVFTRMQAAELVGQILDNVK